MREKWARRIAIFTGGLIVALAMLFAYSQNPRQIESPPPIKGHAPIASEHSASLVELGKHVYAEQGCARCHSIAGRGNPRDALDDVGARLSEAKIRAWVTPVEAQATSFQARHADIELSPDQREALVAYLLSLRG